jgi:hypothetical protein
LKKKKITKWSGEVAQRGKKKKKKKKEKQQWKAAR